MPLGASCCESAFENVFRGKPLGFRVTLCDSREAAADPGRIPPSSVRLVHAEHDDPEVRSGLPPRLDRTALLVMTHDHQLDQAVIGWALERGFGFVGGVGSRAKAARTRQRLEQRGVAASDIGRVRMPVGADIGARSPAEIGVAIAAELIAWRAGLASSRGRARAGAADDDSISGKFIKIKRMHRLTEFVHDVIRDVRDIINRALADGFEPFDKPFGRRADFNITNNPRRKTMTQIIIFDSDQFKI